MKACVPVTSAGLRNLETIMGSLLPLVMDSKEYALDCGLIGVCSSTFFTYVHVHIFSY